MGNKFGWHNGTAKARNIEVSNLLSVRGASVVGTLPMVKGDIWYVDKGITTGGDGKSWATAFKTITAAFTAAGDYDAILVAAGFYTEAATITVTQIGLKLIGCNSSGKTRGPCGIKTPTAAGPILSLTSNTSSTGSNDMEICNISFIASGAQKGIQLGTAAGGYVWRTHIHDCAFFGDSLGTYAIAVYGATTTPSAGAFPDCAECVIENCHFYAWITACASICAYGTRVLVRNNTLFIVAGATGIVAGCGRPFMEISGNKILGVNSTDVGIRITGDDDTSMICEGNILLNLSLGLTQDISDAGIASNNFIHGAAGVPASVDPRAA